MTFSGAYGMNLQGISRWYGVDYENTLLLTGFIRPGE